MMSPRGSASLALLAPASIYVRLCHGSNRLSSCCIPAWIMRRLVPNRVPFLAAAQFINNGTLFPFYHKAYWMGLYSNADEYPKYLWYDRRFKGPGSGGYGNWGSGAQRKQYCAVGNASMTIRATGAWGWNDQNCSFTFPFICRVRSEFLRAWAASAVGCLLPAGLRWTDTIICKCMRAKRRNQPTHLHQQNAMFKCCQPTDGTPPHVCGQCTWQAPALSDAFCPPLMMPIRRLQHQASAKA